jgi:two-component system LytT family sensor kinase
MTNILYFMIDAQCVLILTLIYFLETDRQNEDKTRSAYNQLSLMVICVLISDSLPGFAEGRSGILYMLISHVFTFLCDAFSCIVAWLWFRYTMMWVSDDRKTSVKRSILEFIPAGIGISGILVNLRYPFLYFFDDKNTYHREPFFFLIFLIAVFYLLSSFIYSLVFYIKQTANNEERQKNRFITLMLIPPVIGCILQAHFYGIPFIWPGVTLSMIALYLKLQLRKEEQERLTIEKMGWEAKQKDISIMLSQIQPHFLYNALATIKGLVLIDPENACEAIDNFSWFLHGNMNSLGSSGLIPFEKEIEHTKQYLSLEHMRFGSRLNIVYNFQSTAFSLPPLTLQPIVENAVRYGATKREEGGLVTISSEYKDKFFVVTVTDNGPGFDPELPKPDGRTHVGIHNVAERIKKQCGGTLVITSTPGKGTIAVIRIPSEGA